MLYPWSRDPGFCGAPVIKSVLIMSSAASMFRSFSLLKNSYPAARLVVLVWALPSMGAWLMGALILYQCRIIEWRCGSFKLTSYLALSTIVSSIMFAAPLLATLLWYSDIHTHTDWSLGLIPGLVIYSLLGSLMLGQITSVPSTRSGLTGLPLSRNLPLYILALVSSASSLGSAAATISGVLGGLLVWVCGVSLPQPPLWVTSLLTRVLACDRPPRHYSGASLAVQAQQRTDEIEQLMTSMYNRQLRQQPRPVIGHPVLQQQPEPQQQHVEQLMSMGFSLQEASRALRQTGGNVEAALTLLVTQLN